MARYGRDFSRGGRGMGGSGRGGGGFGQEFGYGAGPEDFRGGSRFGAGGELRGGRGGMRSDAYGPLWRDFPGEEGWLGAGYEGYPGGDYRGYGAGGYAGRVSGYGDEYGRGYNDFDRGDSSYDGWGSGGQRGQQSDADRIRAAEIMTEDPEVVTPDTKVSDVAKKMRDLDVGIIPVVENEDSRRLKGVVTDRDLAVRVLAEGKDGKAKVADFMTKDIETVNKNDTIHRVLDVMKREQIRRVPVTDRDGRLVGIIAQADLAVDYAGLDLHRETEVEEVIERISEPARPRRSDRGGRGGMWGSNR